MLLSAFLFSSGKSRKSRKKSLHMESCFACLVLDFIALRLGFLFWTLFSRQLAYSCTSLGSVRSAFGIGYLAFCLACFFCVLLRSARTACFGLRCFLLVPFVLDSFALLPACVFGSRFFLSRLASSRGLLLFGLRRFLLPWFFSLLRVHRRFPFYAYRPQTGYTMSQQGLWWCRPCPNVVSSSHPPSCALLTFMALKLSPIPNRPSLFERRIVMPVISLL